MVTQKLVFTFPARIVREPITYHLVKDHDLLVNIMSASISPDEQGHMVVALTGEPGHIARGKSYLDRVGVAWEPLVQDVRWIEEQCVHCTACVSACPSAALSVERSTMRVSFDEEKCIGCGLCVPVCSYNAMEVRI